MRDSAVQNVSTVYALTYSLNTAVNFRNHSAAYDALVFKAWNFADIYNGNKCVLVVLVTEQASYVGHEDKLLGVELCGNG